MFETAVITLFIKFMRKYEWFADTEVGSSKVEEILASYLGVFSKDKNGKWPNLSR